MRRWHTTLAERFSQFPKHQQLLMVANEINRANNLMNNLAEYKNALERALELIDLLSQESQWLPALFEIRRARELIAQYYMQTIPTAPAVLLRCLIQLDTSTWRYVGYTDR